MFNKANLAVAEAADKSRYNEGAIFFSKSGTIGTDGHIAVHVSCPKFDEKEIPMIGGEKPVPANGMFAVSRENVVKIKKSIPNNPRVPILNHAFVLEKDGKKSLATTDFQSVTLAPASDDMAPHGIQRTGDLSCVTPEGEPTFTIGISAKLMMRFMKILAEACDGQYLDLVKLSFWDKDKAILAEAENKATEQKIIGLIMPCKL